MIDETKIHSPRGRIDRRGFLLRAGAAATAVSFAGILAGCGDGDEASGTTSGKPTAGALDVSSGSTIPKATVKFGMAPFADASFYAIAMKRGWYEDVGITIAPAPTGLSVTPDNVTSKLVTGEADIATFYGPGRVANLAKAPNLKMFGFSDTYIGTYLLAAPDSGLKPVSALVREGMPFASAMKQAMSGVRGKAVALDATGQSRDFINQIFALGGLSTSDVKVNVASDAQILALANGRKVQFANPNGAAQNLALVSDGWFPLVSVDDLLKGLPPGDPRAVTGIGHEGPACTDEYYSENEETCLRFLSVMFRTIDAIQKDPITVLADQAPYMTSVSGQTTSARDLATIFKVNSPLVSFEDQTQFWTDLEGPRSYQTIYGAKIAAAVRGGALPKASKLTADDAINGRAAYVKLVALKNAYEDTARTKSKLTGQAAELATAAKRQSDVRNYLDAYRLIKAAVAA